MKIYVQNPLWGDTTIFRQSSQFTGRVGPHLWTTIPEDDIDYVLCDDIDSLPETLRHFSKSKYIYVVHENPAVWKPEPSFLSRYGLIVSPFKLDCPPDTLLIQSPSGVPWFYGIPFKIDQGLLHCPQSTTLELDALLNRRIFPKRKLLSMVCSGKAGLPGHKWRIAVANALISYFGKDVDVFGFGHKPLADKADALDRYQYSVVIENCSSTHYWTEKLADCLIGGAVPIYSGATNAVHDLGWDFPLIQFGTEPTVVAKQIATIVDSFSCRYEHLISARYLTLYRYNLLYLIPHLIES